MPNRKVVVGHWSDAGVQERLGVWSRAACAWADSQDMRVARFGDNMRDVAVTEGNKISAQIHLGYDVYGYGMGDLKVLRLEKNQGKGAALRAGFQKIESDVVILIDGDGQDDEGRLGGGVNPVQIFDD